MSDTCDLQTQCSNCTELEASGSHLQVEFLFRRSVLSPRTCDACMNAAGCLECDKEKEDVLEEADFIVRI